MQTEKEAYSSSRYLLCTSFFADNSVDQVKEDVRKFMVAKTKDDEYFQFINWQKGENEIVVLTMYAYADILLPKIFDTIFEINDTANYIHSEFSITQAILNGWTATHQIACGHKHIIILKFPESLPTILNLLPTFSNSESFKNQPEIGLCNKEDFEEIKENLKQKLYD